MHRSLLGKEVCFIGRLASMRRGEAEQRTLHVGGRPVSIPGVSTSYLIIGDVLQTGSQATRKLAAFKDLKEKGASIELVGEE